MAEGFVFDTVEGYYTPLNDLFVQEMESHTDPINVFGIIVSSSLPKVLSNRASHKFMVQLCIIDPTLPSSAESIGLNWFTNEREGLDTLFKIGDIVRAENVKAQTYQNFPQLVGKADKASMNIFHRKESYLSGLPPHSLIDVTEQVNTSRSESLPPNRSYARDDPHHRPAGLESHSSTPFRDPLWDVITFGVDFTMPKAKKIASTRPFHSSSSSSSSSAAANSTAAVRRRKVLMWPREVAVLHRIAEWCRIKFSQCSLSAFGHDASLHDIQMYLHNSVKSSTYAQMRPPAPFDQQRAENWDRSNTTLLNTGKCDVVGLVTNVIPPIAGGDPMAKMSVWDGTTSGMYQAAPGYASRLYMAINAPAEYAKAATAALATVATTNAAATAAAAAAAAAATSMSVGGGEGGRDTTNAEAAVREMEEKVLGMSDTTAAAATATSSAGAVVGAAAPPSAVSNTVYLGSAVRIRAATVDQNVLILRCKVGMWVRIRNVHAVTTSIVVPTTAAAGAAAGALPHLDATVHGDTHICPLSPYYRDVTNLTSRYFTRLAQHFVHTAALQASAGAANSRKDAATAQGPGRAKSGSSGVIAAASGTVPGVANRRLVGPPSGLPITPLALVVAGPAPAKFCTRVMILDYWPKHLKPSSASSSSGDATGKLPSRRSRFSLRLHPQQEEEEDEQGEDQEQESVLNTQGQQRHTPGSSSINDGEEPLLFALKVADTSDQCHVLLQGSEAEKFFEITKEEYHASPARRREIEERLQTVIAQGLIFEIKVKVYLFKEVASALKDVPTKNGKKKVISRKSTMTPKHMMSYVKKTRRILAFDTVCPNSM